MEVVIGVCFNLIRQVFFILMCTEFARLLFVIKNNGMIPKKLEFIVNNLLSTSYPEGFGLEPKHRMTPYHQVFLSPNEEVREKREDFPSLSNGTFYLSFILGGVEDSDNC